MTPYPIVYLVDVDNTLIDNDGIQQDLQDHLERVYGPASRVRYWKILEDLFGDLGYRDYLGSLQRYRVEHPRQVELLAMSSFLIDYPFARDYSRPRSSCCSECAPVVPPSSCRTAMPCSSRAR